MHGWDGYPEEGLFPWLKKELEARNFAVFVPQLPKPDEPKIHNWVPRLKEIVGIPDEQTYFVGHSMGCQTIVRYLASLPEKQSCGGAVFVAGFFKKLTNMENDEVRKIANEWLSVPLDFVAARKNIPKSVAIFSDNDPYVPLDNMDDFKDKLESKVIVKATMGHFSGSKGIVELPEALEAVLRLAA